MQVIKKGTLPNEKLYRGTCYHCRAVVECESGEIKYGQYGLERIVDCPTTGCGRYIDVFPLIDWI